MIGQSIGNHKITAKLGQGGMGTVYEAEDTTLGRKVAIKILNPSLTAQGGKELERFQAEAKVQASLNHPNVVTLHNFEPVGNSYAMVMEYVQGRTLADLVRAVGALPAHVVVNVAKQALDGLSAAHKRGIVHRDLKPSNIMLTPEGIAKVMDFGIAKVQGGKSLTATGALVGTVFYMSPEQVRGEIVDARSDIYSFGVILFELLTGRVPFIEESDFKIMIDHVQTPPPLPTKLLPHIPGALEDIVMRCLEKDAATRFQTADELIGAFDAFEEQDRAMGRGQLYTRRALAQWVSAPKPEAATATESATVLDAEAPATLPPVPPVSTAATLLDSQPVAVPAPPPPPRTAGYQPAPVQAAPPIPAAAPAPAKKGLFIVIALLGVLVIGGIGGYMFLTSSGLVGGQPPQTMTASMPAPSEPASPRSAPQPEAQPPAADLQSPSAQPGPGPAVTQPPASTSSSLQSRPGRGPGPRPAVSQSPASALAPSAPAPAVPAPAEKLPAAFLIFFDADQSSERLPLGTAVSRVSEIIRQSGHPVLSSGAVAANVRSALDAQDFAGVRRNGVGYVVLGTANGSLEQQNAYGTTYHVARVQVNFELVRMSDGGVASTGSGEGKSRGSANPSAALSEALMTATSDAARALMREFTP